MSINSTKWVKENCQVRIPDLRPTNVRVVQVDTMSYFTPAEIPIGATTVRISAIHSEDLPQQRRSAHWNVWK